MSFQPEPLPDLPMTLAQAIARMEGFYAAGQVPNRPQRNNNPGDIEFGPFAERFGATSGDPRFAIFPTVAKGFEALDALLRTPHYLGLTVEEAVNRYAPPVENNTSLYVAAVCHWTGKQSTDTLSSFLEAV